MLTRVIIVKAGGRMSLSADAGDYDSMIEFLERTLNGFKSVTEPEQNCAQATVVNSVEEAESAVEEGRADMLIFLTLGLRHEADRIKKQHPTVKVVVLTGLLPDDEVVLVEKEWMSTQLLRDLL